jgi:hypothetical protein
VVKPATPAQAGDIDRTLAVACDQVGLTPAGATLLGRAANTVGLLPREAVVVRARRNAIPTARRTVRIARWLAEREVPVIRLVPDLPQPLEVEGHAVTFWRAGQPSTTPWEGADLAGPLRELHRWQPPDQLPTWDPIPALRRRVEAVTALPLSDLEWLVAELDRLESDYREMRSRLPEGIIHTDAHLGNLVRDRAGRVLLADLDGVARGPVLQDLVPTAVNALRFRRMVRHRTLAIAYGLDVTEEPAWPVLRRIRELSTTVGGLIRSGDGDGGRTGAAREWRLRLRLLQADAGNARWHSPGPVRS